MPFDQPIIQVMTENVATLDVNQKLSNARSLFSERQIHHLPVVDDDKLVGIIRSNDVIQLSKMFDGNGSVDEFLNREYPVHKVMQKNPLSIGVEATIREAAQILATGSFHALPVVGYNNILKGIVTSTDLIKLLLEKLPHTAAA